MVLSLSTFTGDAIYLDTMILVSYLRPQSSGHPACARFIGQALQREPPIYLTSATLTADELVFVLMQELVADPPYAVTRSRSQYLNAHPDVARDLMQAIDPALGSLLELIALEPVQPEDITEMRREMLASGTLPRDAIHVAVMRRLGITAVATDDEGFERCAGITVYRP